MFGLSGKKAVRRIHLSVPVQFEGAREPGCVGVAYVRETADAKHRVGGAGAFRFVQRLEDTNDFCSRLPEIIYPASCFERG